MAYTTVAKVESYLRTTFSPTTAPTDTEVADWVASVDSEVDNLTGTSWTPTSYTQYVSPSNTTSVFLTKKFPLNAVTSIEYNSGTEHSPVWTAFDNYYTDGDLIKTDKSVYGERKVKIVYDYGFDAPTPEVELLATLLVVKKIVGGDAVSKSGTQSLSIGSLSITKNVGAARLANLDSTIKEQLKKIGKFNSILR